MKQADGTSVNRNEEAVNRADEQYERKTVGCEIYVKVSEIALTAPEKQDTIGLHLEGVVLIRHPTDAAWKVWRRIPGFLYRNGYETFHVII